MTKWEYMFVQVWKEKLTKVNALWYKKVEERPDWQIWLGNRGIEGWELVSEYSFQEYSVHATLKRPIE
jgi:hypothetical protein